MKKLIALLCILILLLSGCTTLPLPDISNPQPTPDISNPQPIPDISNLQPMPDISSSPSIDAEESGLTQLQSDLLQLTQHPRPIGSKGEADAANYLKNRFGTMGLLVTLQEYVSESGITGNNVVAVKKAGETSDILVISAHHDSSPTSFGANDNASGVAALLMIAEKLVNTESDTELRFISFTDEENGKNGSRHYIESLSEDERKRIVGCIQLDMLGGLGSEGVTVCTVDGSANWLSKLLMEQDSTLALGTETASDHATFQLAGIPSVVVTQVGRGYLYHTAGDTTEQLNLDDIHLASSIVTDAVALIASAETPSYQETAQKQAGSYLYHHSRQSHIFYSMSRQENEAYLGMSGQMVQQWEVKGDGWIDTYKAYEYQIRWFDSKQPMPTHYIYRNDYLEDVKIYPSQAGYTIEDVKALITNTYGEPTQADNAAKSWSWADELYGKYISLKEVNGEAVVQVNSYSLGIGNLLASYDVTAGNAVIEDPRHAKVWELLCTAIPLEHRQKIGQFQLFTDGFSNILAYAATTGEPSQPDNTHFSITIDYYDVYDEHGTPRDQSKLLYTLIHEYGHVLLENDTQINVAVEPNIHNPAGFIEGSFRQRYYEEFWQDPYSSHLGSYWDNPENYVSEYAGNMFHEDIADTFAVFVFGSKPDGESIAEKKILFFWDDSDMGSLRSDIRTGLSLN